METTIVNLFGGPCSGKSTVASAVYYDLKRKGYQTELATEFAKDLCWDENYQSLQDLIYLFGNLFHRISRLINKVNYIIVDSPLLLCITYHNYYEKCYPLNSKYWDDFVLEQFNQFNNYNYFLNRSNEFSDIGRAQNLEESKKIDNDILNLLNTKNVPYSRIDTSIAKNIIVADLIR